VKKKVLLAGRINQAGINLLAARDDIEYFIAESDTEDLVRLVDDVHGIVVRTARITREVVAAAPKLRVVARHGVGYDGVDVAALTERGIPLTITIHGNAIAVAEHVMFMLLALTKRGVHYDRETRSGRWQSRGAFDAGELHGRTLLVLGFGRTGSRVAPLARAFSMRVLVCDPYLDQDTIAAAGFEFVHDFRAVLPHVDAVTVHTPLTNETLGIIGERELRLLRPGAVVVNTARGGIVDETALAAALASGQVGGEASTFSWENRRHHARTTLCSDSTM
jgi:D-3-phosphoglycerate dehydrogenase